MHETLFSNAVPQNRLIRWFDPVTLEVVVDESNDLRGPYSWSGREGDCERGLQYDRAHGFDPCAGRWLGEQ